MLQTAYIHSIVTVVNSIHKNWKGFVLVIFNNEDNFFDLWPHAIILFLYGIINSSVPSNNIAHVVGQKHVHAVCAQITLTVFRHPVYVYAKAKLFVYCTNKGACLGYFKKDSNNGCY